MTSGSQSTRYMACSTLYLECILYAGWHCSCRYSNLVSRSFPVVLSSSPDNPDNRRDSYCCEGGHPWRVPILLWPNILEARTAIGVCLLFETFSSLLPLKANSTTIQIFLRIHNLRYRNSIVIFIYRTKSSYVEQPLLLLWKFRSMINFAAHNPTHATTHLLMLS